MVAAGVQIDTGCSESGSPEGFRREPGSLQEWAIRGLAELLAPECRGATEYQPGNTESRVPDIDLFNACEVRP